MTEIPSQVVILAFVSPLEAGWYEGGGKESNINWTNFYILILIIWIFSRVSFSTDKLKKKKKKSGHDIHIWVKFCRWLHSQCLLSIQIDHLSLCLSSKNKSIHHFLPLCYSLWLVYKKEEQAIQKANSIHESFNPWYWLCIGKIKWNWLHFYIT